MRVLRWCVLGVWTTLLLSGCSGEQATSTPFVNDQNNQASSVGGGGNLILAMFDDPDTLDPALISDTGGAFLARQLFSGLVKLDQNLEAVPDLAESIEVSDDEQVYTFRLHADAQFADGTPITAEKVRWSLERATDPQLGGITAPGYFDDIAGLEEKLSGAADSVSGIEVVDERTLQITLQKPSSIFLQKFSHTPALIVDQRAVEQGGDWFEQPNGSGPFMINRWDRRERLELVPNPRYVGTAAELDQVTFLIGPNASNPLGLYERGELDLTAVGAYSLDRINSPEDPLNDELREVPQLSLDYIAFNTTLPPFDDPNIREAFSLLIDREKLAEVSYNGTLLPARGVLPPGMPGARPDELPLPAADVERAKQLIAESSYNSVENLPPIVAYTAGGSVGLLAQIAHDELGITIDVRSQDKFIDYLTALREDDYQLYDLGWIADYPDPQNFLEVLFGSNGQYNFSGYANPEYEQLLADAQRERDEERRGELYRQAEKILLDDHVLIPLTHQTSYTIVKPYINDLEITPLGILDLAPVDLER